MFTVLLCLSPPYFDLMEFTALAGTVQPASGICLSLPSSSSPCLGYRCVPDAQHVFCEGAGHPNASPCACMENTFLTESCDQP